MMKSTKKILGLVLVMLLLNPNPLVSDAQVRGAITRTKKDRIMYANAMTREPSRLEWVCFHPEQVTVEQSEVLYNGAAVSMPEMQAVSADESYEISLGGDVTGDYDVIFSKWQDLIRTAQNVCVSVEFIQTLDQVDGVNHSLWTIRSMKTDRGEWSEADLASAN